MVFVDLRELAEQMNRMGLKVPGFHLITRICDNSGYGVWRGEPVYYEKRGNTYYVSPR